MCRRTYLSGEKSDGWGDVMKTLDEVIKAWSICFSDNSRSNCTGCPYADEDGEAACFNHDREDALRYLKAYRDDKDELTALRAYWAEQQANPPLTWDELNAMEGEPVWATFDNENGTWYIAKVYDDEVVLYEWGQEFGERISGAWDYTPKRWQAYRKERE